MLHWNRTDSNQSLMTHLTWPPHKSPFRLTESPYYRFVPVASDKFSVRDRGAEFGLLKQYNGILREPFCRYPRTDTARQKTVSGNPIWA